MPLLKHGDLAFLAFRKLPLTENTAYLSGGGNCRSLAGGKPPLHCPLLYALIH